METVAFFDQLNFDNPTNDEFEIDYIEQYI